MITSVNGVEQPWSIEVWDKWAPVAGEIATAHPEAKVSRANYYTPRPWRNEYDRGDRKEGFVYIIGRQVVGVCLNGLQPWRCYPQDGPRPGGSTTISRQ